MAVEPGAPLDWRQGADERPRDREALSFRRGLRAGFFRNAAQNAVLNAR